MQEVLVIEEFAVNLQYLYRFIKPQELLDQNPCESNIKNVLFKA